MKTTIDQWRKIKTLIDSNQDDLQILGLEMGEALLNQELKYPVAGYSLTLAVIIIIQNHLDSEESFDKLMDYGKNNKVSKK